MLFGAGAKAFCAGGDVLALSDARQAGRRKAVTDFFWHEYRLNHRIATYPKQLIAIMDGLTMGGGAGLALNAPIRVATERAIFAMPECAIGFFPDVGAGHFLNRCPGSIGLFLALTGQRRSRTNYCELATASGANAAQLLLEPCVTHVRTRTADIERMRPGLTVLWPGTGRDDDSPSNPQGYGRATA
jgi:enoyl-CoA hydratase/carnithine racemase